MYSRVSPYDGERRRKTKLQFLAIAGSECRRLVAVDLLYVKSLVDHDSEG